MTQPRLTLVIGNRNYSSWSLRGWLAAKRSGLPFDEILIPLDQPETSAKIRAHSKAGLVPILKIGETAVWDSLAIVEALHELAPEAGLWPADPMVRAVARSVACEMHSGFVPMRRDMPMDLRAERPGVGHTDAALANVRRIDEVWRQCRDAYGRAGAFLFGKFSGADIMYAPVVGRFRTYGPPLSAASRAYMDAVWNEPDMAEWVAASREEPWMLNP